MLLLNPNYLRIYHFGEFRELITNYHLPVFRLFLGFVTGIAIAFTHDYITRCIKVTQHAVVIWMKIFKLKKQ